MQSFLSHISQLFLKSSCQSCQRPTSEFFCPFCQAQLQTGIRSPLIEPPSKLHPLPLFAWATYDTSLRQIIQQLKYKKQPAIGTWLGTEMAKSWITTGLHQQFPRLLVIPIPMHKSKQQQRGYNQAEIISRSFARQIGYRHQPSALIRIRETQPQSKLGLNDRAQNLESAFSLAPNFKTNQPILLVDDIFTTGATLRTAIKLLEDHNIPIWGSAVTTRGDSEMTPKTPKNTPILKKKIHHDRGS
jgi:ComF family protein